MKMNGIHGSGKTSVLAGQNMLQGTDEATKRLQKQIADAQKALQELSANKDMSVEEKMQKRQELQQRINDLNNQLRQRQIDLRRERQQAKKESDDEMAAGKQQKKADAPGHGISKASMEAMVSADNAKKQAKVYGAVGIRLKGEARVLAGEIKLDKDRGLDVGQKEGKLAKLEERMEDATASQVGTLEDASKKLQKAGEKEREEKQKEDEKTKEDEKIKEDKKIEEEEKKEDRKFVDIRL